MKLIWKLLRQHLSLSQGVGFFLANLLGMYIILLGVQFYSDIQMLIEGDGVLSNKEYVVITKQGSSYFTKNEIRDLGEQHFVESVGAFTASLFEVTASLNMPSLNRGISSDLFFESVPDKYIDVDLENWSFDSSDDNSEIPIVLPRNYLNLYNFGFAQSKDLPKLSERVISMITMNITIYGINREVAHRKGRIVGFSDRLNTILVPLEFIDWANQTYAPNVVNHTSRLIIESYPNDDAQMAEYLGSKNYRIEGDRGERGKMAYILQIITSIVIAIGVLITLLSLYILMLSIFLLLEKNIQKIENLIIIGYTTSTVALPYQLLSLALGLVSLIVAIIGVVISRNVYISHLSIIYPDIETSFSFTSILTGIVLCSIAWLFNMWTIRRRVNSI